MLKPKTKKKVQVQGLDQGLKQNQKVQVQVHS